jgi:hypothetical protein
VTNRIRNRSVTIEFTIQDWDDDGSDIVSLRSFVDGEIIPLTHPGREILFDIARRFRIVQGGSAVTESFLHIETEKIVYAEDLKNGSL